MRGPGRGQGGYQAFWLGQMVTSVFTKRDNITLTGRKGWWPLVQTYYDSATCKSSQWRYRVNTWLYSSKVRRRKWRPCCIYLVIEAKRLNEITFSLSGPTFSRFLSWPIPWKSIFGYHTEGKVRYTYRLSQWFCSNATGHFLHALGPREATFPIRSFFQDFCPCLCPCASLSAFWDIDFSSPSSHYHCFYKERKKKG